MIDYGKIKIDLKNETLECNGITFSAFEAQELKNAYERMETAKLLIDNEDVSEETAFKLACDIREKCASNDMTESEALQELPAF